MTLGLATSRFDFNPRSREGSDYSQDNDPLQPEISIHAPVKGATMTEDDAKAMVTISIHAPVKGATAADKQVYRGQRFQSTLP